MATPGATSRASPVRGRDVASFVAEAEERLREEVPLPPGYYVTWGGQFENLQSVNVPVAAVGGVFALAVRGLPFSISAGIGFIALFGVAVPTASSS